MIHSGKARTNHDQQRRSLVDMIKQQQMRSNDVVALHDPAADPRHVAFIQSKLNK